MTVSGLYKWDIVLTLDIGMALAAWMPSLSDQMASWKAGLIRAGMILRWDGEMVHTPRRDSLIDEGDSSIVNREWCLLQLYELLHSEAAATQGAR